MSSKTPREITQRLNREFNAALALPDVRAKVQELVQKLYATPKDIVERAKQAIRP